MGSLSLVDCTTGIMAYKYNRNEEQGLVLPIGRRATSSGRARTSTFHRGRTCSVVSHRSKVVSIARHCGRWRNWARLRAAGERVTADLVFMLRGESAP